MVRAGLRLTTISQRMALKLQIDFLLPQTVGKVLRRRRDDTTKGSGLE